ncbi:MAG TPA: nucleotidyltransferase family protein [Longimicrobium sp.]|nr:nucleotidyltransferase family protein [Longimicrobium sp.]
MPGDAPALPFGALDMTADEVERRFRQARERGTPRWLWPELPVERWMAGRREIVRVAGELLAGRPARLDAGDAVGAEALGIAAFTLGMGALLGHWIERGSLQARPSTAALLRLHLEHGRARAERAAAELDAALAVLAAAGATATVIKGMHTARAFFPEPGTRPMTDIDLVIDPEHVPAAERALAAAGYQRLRGDFQRHPYHADWRPPGHSGRDASLALAHRDNPLTVNLHASFDRTTGTGTLRMGTPGPGDTAAMPGVRTPSRVLAGPFLLATLAAHAAEHRENLLLVRVVELVLAMRAGADVTALRAFLDARRMAHHVYPALALAERLAPGTVDAELLAFLEARSGARVRKVVEALDLSALQRLDQPVAGGRTLAVRGPADRARAVLTWLVPHRSPARLAAAYRSRLERLIRLLARR